MSGTVGTGKRCPPWRASDECVRVCVRVRLSFSSARKSLGLLVCGLVYLYSRSPGFLVEPVWMGVGGVGEEPEGTAPRSWPRALLEAARSAAGTWDLSEDACPTTGTPAVQGCGPGCGQGRALALRSRVWAPHGGRVPWMGPAETRTRSRVNVCCGRSGERTVIVIVTQLVSLAFCVIDFLLCYL